MCNYLSRFRPGKKQTLYCLWFLETSCKNFCVGCSLFSIFRVGRAHLPLSYICGLGALRSQKRLLSPSPSPKKKFSVRKYIRFRNLSSPPSIFVLPTLTDFGVRRRTSPVSGPGQKIRILEIICLHNLFIYHLAGGVGKLLALFARARWTVIFAVGSFIFFFAKRPPPQPLDPSWLPSPPRRRRSSEEARIRVRTGPVTSYASFGLL